MGIYDELSKLNVHSPIPKLGKSTGKGMKKKVQKEISITRLVDQPAAQPTDQPSGQSTRQPTNSSIDPLTQVDTLGPVVDRPRSFYITQKLDNWLDEGVRHLQEKGMHKADRSVLLNALLHDPALFLPSHLEQIRQKLLAHLTNKSLKRVQ